MKRAVHHVETGRPNNQVVLLHHDSDGLLKEGEVEGGRDGDLVFVELLEPFVDDSDGVVDLLGVVDVGLFEQDLDEDS